MPATDLIGSEARWAFASADVTRGVGSVRAVVATEQGMVDHAAGPVLGSATRGRDGGHEFHPRESQRRRNNSEKLFAGMASMIGAENPWTAASDWTASMSRTPHAGFLDFRSASNAALLGAVCSPFRRYGP